MSDFEKFSRKVDSRLKHDAEESVADFRDTWWENWPQDMRDRFKVWLLKYAELANNLPDIFPEISVRLEFFVPTTPDGDGYSYSLSRINALVKAIECWERGELYAPAKLGELI